MENVTSPVFAEKVQRLLHHFSVIADPTSKTNTFGNASTHEAVEESAAAIRRLLEGPAGLDLLLTKEIRPFLYEGLKHYNDEVQLLTLTQLVRCAEQEKTLSVLDDQTILGLLLEKLKGESIGIAEKAATILIKIAAHPEGRKIFFHNNVLVALKKIEFTNETVKFRVLDIVASVASRSAELFQLCEANSFMSDTVSLLDVNDPLQQLNVIELFEKISSLHEGAAYLEQKGALSKLESILFTDDPIAASILVPRVIRFFGNLSTKGEAELKFIETSKVIPFLKKALEDDEATNEVKDSALSAVGQIGSSPHGLSLLISSSTLSVFLTYVNNETELRLSCLHSLAHLLKNIPKEATSSLEQILLQVQNRKGVQEPIINIIMPFVHTPFPELRYAAYNVMNGLAQHAWGAALLLNYSGYFEWLLNRNSDETKQGKEWKFSIIESLVNTIEKKPDLLERTKFLMLKKYISDGVFYMAAQSTMQIETKST